LLPKVHAEGAALDRYSENAALVPELSERWTVAILEEGRWVPGLSAAIAGAFHIVTLPAKISAMVLASSFRAAWVSSS